MEHFRLCVIIFSPKKPPCMSDSPRTRLRSIQRLIRSNNLGVLVLIQGLHDATACFKVPPSPGSQQLINQEALTSICLSP